MEDSWVKMKKKENYKLLALDLSLSNSGVAVFGSDGYPECVYSISTNSSEKRGKRLKFIGDELQRIIEEYPILEVAIEKGFSRYNRSTQALYNVMGVALYILHDLPVFFYASSSIKKKIANKGNASKKSVQEAVLKRYPDLKFEDFDQSDSVAVGIVHLIEKGILKDEQKWD